MMIWLGCTPSSVSTASASSPVRLRACVCTVTGTPVARWARPTARSTRSTSGVIPSRSMAHFSIEALTSTPSIPLTMSWTNMSTRGSSSTTSAPAPRSRKYRGISFSTYSPVEATMFTGDRSATLATSRGCLPMPRTVRSTIVSIPASFRRRIFSTAASTASSSSQSMAHG